MKKLFLSAGIISVLGLAACGETENTNSNSTNDTENTETTEATETSIDSSTDEESTEDGNEDGFVKDLNEAVTDNDNFKATLVSIEKAYDDFWDEETITVNFEVENKTDSTLTFQAREVSVDGKMVDETLLTMSQDVSGGKIADAELSIQDYEGGDLPLFESDFEMLLHVFDMETYETVEDVEVAVEF
ncbi:hypothetical protein NSQ54_08280 [Alkalihalobacillus sp. FSL W8-0930]